MAARLQGYSELYADQSDKQRQQQYDIQILSKVILNESKYKLETEHQRLTQIKNKVTDLIDKSLVLPSVHSSFKGPQFDYQKKFDIIWEQESKALFSMMNQSDACIYQMLFG